MRLFLDTCCLNRLDDESTEERVRREAEAVRRVLVMIRAGTHQLLSSEAQLNEVRQTQDPARRAAALQRITDLASEVVPLSRGQVERTVEIRAIGFSPKDAIQLASGEACGADVFLSVDIRLVNCARRNPGSLGLVVTNPVDWLSEEGR